MYSMHENREAAMLHKVLLKHRNELNIATAVKAELGNPVEDLYSVVEYYGGAKYLKQELETHGPKSGLHLVLQWHVGQTESGKKHHDQVDLFIENGGFSKPKEEK